MRYLKFTSSCYSTKVPHDLHPSHHRCFVNKATQPSPELGRLNRFCTFTSLFLLSSSLSPYYYILSRRSLLPRRFVCRPFGLGQVTSFERRLTSSSQWFSTAGKTDFDTVHPSIRQCIRYNSLRPRPPLYQVTVSFTRT